MSAELRSLPDVFCGEDGKRALIEARLQAFSALVEKWNPSINIVAKSTVSDVWTRHILDSAQLAQFLPMQGLWLDLGSGGGFPGLVIACFAEELRPEVRIRLVESDQRKSVFLREAARQLGLRVEVITDRIENLAPQSATRVSARALASLRMLCDLSIRHLAPDGVCLFLKGGKSDEEIDDARRAWDFDLVRHPSHTSQDSSVLEIRRLRRV